MCYRQPDKMIELLLAQPLPINHLGHTALDDFDHFCALTGLDEDFVGKEAFAWAKSAFLFADR